MTAAVAPPPPRVEKILCSNVTSDVNAHSDAEIFRHSVFGYDEQLEWPPAGWERLRCWHCSEVFDTHPVPLPHEVDRKTGCFRVFGVFCGFPCSKRYLLDHVHWTAGERVLLLEEMAREVFHYEGPDISAAPPRHRLSFFGGDLSIEEFRGPQKGITACISPPLISMPEVYERVLPSAEPGTETWSVRGIRPIPEAPVEQKPPQVTLSSFEGRGAGQGLYDSYVPAKSKPAHAPAEASAGNSTLTMFLKKR